MGHEYQQGRGENGLNVITNGVGMHGVGLDQHQEGPSSSSSADCIVEE